MCGEQPPCLVGGDAHGVKVKHSQSMCALHRVGGPLSQARSAPRSYVEAVHALALLQQALHHHGLGR
jgi:hypothetical protein